MGLHFLPTLVIGPDRWRLPLGRCAAEVLVDVVLAPQSEHAPRRLAEALAADPALTAWLWATLPPERRLGVDGLESLAERYCAAELATLRWAAEAASPDDASLDAVSLLWAERFRDALELAEAAGPTGRLAAFLASAAQWGRHDLGTEAVAVFASSTAPTLENALSPAAMSDPPRSPSAVLDSAKLWAADAAAVRLRLLTGKLARLGDLEQEFAGALERAKLESLAEFAAGAGHEINNPLMVITGRAQLLLRQETDAERRRSLALIHAQALRIDEMIANLRLFARPPVPQRRRVDLVALADEVLAGLAARAEEQQTTLVRMPHAGPLEANLDPAQIATALQVLCLNALEALDHGGRIEVHLERRAAEVRLRVCDDGPGFTAAQRTHLFDPFFSARQAGRGLGLGLSKCWRIVTGHGGQLAVESPSGSGATFTLVFPDA